uniref:Strictosidine synthase conserved region domain-containing protein n=1 Tax=Setaria digitata TaxID=48799 RepID=A0A915Q6S7_9BILA
MMERKPKRRKLPQLAHRNLFEDLALSTIIHPSKIKKSRQSSILPKPPELTGALRPNQELTHAEILLLNQINGPESIALHQKSKTIYVGLKTGFIAAIEIDKLRDVDCGRPLGMRFNRKYPDLLIVADAYHGFFEVNIQNETIRQILEPGTKITHSLSRPVVHFNDFDISHDGYQLIFTEPSHRFADRDYLYAMAEHRPDGRLLHYDMRTGILRVLLNALQYPNGVEFDKTGKCVFFSEMGNLRILRYCFHYNTGKYTVIARNLPGYPDNIRTASNGMLWVPLGQARLKDDSWITESPKLRDLFATALYFIQSTSEIVLFSLYIVSNALFTIVFDYLSPKYGLLLLIDPTNGTILRSFHDPSGLTISSISQAIELNDGTVLLGGDDNSFLARFKPSARL